MPNFIFLTLNFNYKSCNNIAKHFFKNKFNNISLNFYRFIHKLYNHNKSYKFYIPKINNYIFNISLIKHNGYNKSYQISSICFDYLICNTLIFNIKTLIFNIKSIINKIDILINICFLNTKGEWL